MKNGIIKWAHIWLTHDVCLYKYPCLIASVIITASVGTKSVVTLRDGTSKSSPVIATFRTPADNTKSFNFAKGIYFDDGVFIDVDGNTTGVMVTWRPVK